MRRPRPKDGYVRNPTGKNGPKKSTTEGVTVTDPALGTFDVPRTEAGPGKRTTLTREQAAYYRDRREKAWKLKLAGASISQIAKQLGYPGKGNVARDIRKVLALMPKWSVIEDRDAEVAKLDARELRLEQMLNEVLALVPGTGVNGVPPQYVHPVADRVKAESTITQRLNDITALRAKLKGLNMPERHEHSGPNGGPVPLANLDVEQLTDADLKRIVAASGGAEPDLGAAGPGRAGAAPAHAHGGGAQPGGRTAH